MQDAIDSKFLFSLLKFRYSKFETLIWPIGEWQIWAKSAKLSFLNCSYLLIQDDWENTAARFYLNNQGINLIPEGLNIKTLLMDNLQFLTILYFIFKHFTVLKQIHTLSARLVLEHFTVLKQTHILSTCRVLEHVVLL